MMDSVMLHAMSRVVSIKTVILLFCLFSAQQHILAVCPCGIDGNRNATNPPPTAEDVSVQRLSIYLSARLLSFNLGSNERARCRVNEWSGSCSPTRSGNRYSTASVEGTINSVFIRFCRCQSSNVINHKIKDGAASSRTGF